MGEINPEFMMSLVEGRFSETSRADLGKVFQAFRESPHSTMVIHFHGGLVSKEAGIAGALDLHERYSGLASCLFPIWETGFLEVLQRGWMDIARDTLFQVIRDRALSAVFAKANELAGTRGATLDYQPGAFLPTDLEESALGAGDVTLPIQNLDLAQLEPLTPLQERQLAGAFARDSRLTAEFQAAINAHVENAEPDTRAAFSSPNVTPRPSVIDRTVLDELVAENTNARGIPMGVALRLVGLVKDVIWRFIQRKDHGLHATTTEEILRALYVSAAGISVWGLMKSYAHDAFREGPEWGGTALLEEIEQLPAEKQVLLIGHSAGSIFISELLLAAAARGLDKPLDIIFLAPAARSDLFARAIRDAAPLIRNFRMYTMTDENECRDVLVRTDSDGNGLAWFYPRSLLYFISGILEREVDASLVGMQRFHRPTIWSAEDASVHSVAGFVAAQPHRVCWSVAHDAGNPRFNANAVSHGDFGHSKMLKGEMNSTIDGICEILRTGQF